MFSIVVPVHNKLPHLDRMMESILNQTYQKFEIILIDDASTDGSQRKIQEFTDPRIRFYKRDIPGPGGYAARNFGIEKAKNPWIAFLDADDSWEKNYLEDKYQAILNYPEAELISTKWNRSEEGKIALVQELSNIPSIYKDFSLLDYFHNYLLVWTTAVAIKKELLQKVKGFPAGKVKRGGDMDTWIRCLYRSKQNIFINKQGATYFRDTINRVTDDTKKVDNILYIPPILKEIREETSDIYIKKAVNIWIANLVWINVKRDLRQKGGIDVKKIKQIPVQKLRILTTIKLYLYKLSLYSKLR